MIATIPRTGAALTIISKILFASMSGLQLLGNDHMASQPAVAPGRYCSPRRSGNGPSLTFLPIQAIQRLPCIPSDSLRWCSSLRIVALVLNPLARADVYNLSN